MIIHQTRAIARTTQQRVISHYLQDVWRTGSWSPTNPLLTWLDDSRTLPSSTMQPYHVSSALAHIQQEAAATDPSSLHQVDAVQGKYDALQQLASLFWLTSSNPKWREALEAIHKNRIFSTDQEQVIYTSFQKLTTDEQEEKWAAQRWIRGYEQRTGVHLPHREEYQMLCEALEDLEAKFQAVPKTLTPAQSKQTMGDMYNYLGIQGRLAELLGYQHYAERIFESRMANIEQVHKLHEQVAAAVLPIVTKGLTQHAALDDYLSSTKNRPVREDDALRKDKAIMLRLEQHVTLEGTLEFIKKLSSELFGLSLVEEELVTGSTWDKDVRLFHVMDDQRRLGSFLFDPYDRSGKTRQPFTASLINRSVHRLPLAVLSMALEPPAWDTEATPMTWQNVETLLHEMAHVYQLLSAQSVTGTLLGAQHLSLDLSELLPKVSTAARF
jgi:Zn-dependent oligopeptidase